MTDLIISSHPILTIILLACYIILFVRNLIGGKALKMDKLVLLVARLSLALLIFTGLLMSFSYNIPVAQLHHILTLIPIIVIIIYQGMARKGKISAKKNVVVFGVLFLSIVAITLVA